MLVMNPSVLTPSGTLVLVPLAPPTGSAGVAVGDRVAVKVTSPWRSKIIWLSAAILPGLTWLYTFLTSAGILAFQHHPVFVCIGVQVIGLLIAYLRKTSNSVTS
jgi:hypothetical protein